MAEKRIKIFTAVNHIGNEFDTLKVAKRYPVKFFYLRNNVRRWSQYSARPEPTTWLTKDEFEWVDYFDPKEHGYDLAIVRCDQQHADPYLGKSQLSRQMLEIIGDKIKVVIVNHGTPNWSEKYDEELVKYGGIVQTTRGPRQIDGIAELVKNAKLMIVNSYEAVARWEGVHPNIVPLIHGMDPAEWWSLPKEPRVVLPLSPAGLDNYYNRSLCTAIKAAVKERSGLDVMHINVNIKFDEDNWTQYRNFLGSSLISIFPFKDSPMPRSRTEAMYAQNCILTSKYHGGSDIFEHGVDGFIMPDNPLSYAEAIHVLINEGYRDANLIGARAREKAIKLFHQDRYLKDFYETIKIVADGGVPKWNGGKIWN